MGDGMTWSRRWKRLLATIAVILVGLVLRRFGYDFGLPFIVVKYGGSVLWGGMVFLLVAFIAGTQRVVPLAVVGLAIAVAVEFSRLYHTPELDAFRLTTAGKLLLGRVFSLWNILSYALGIALAVVFDRRFIALDRDQ